MRMSKAKPCPATISQSNDGGDLTNFSTRIPREMRRAIRRRAIETDSSIQDVTIEAFTKAGLGVKRGQ